ncbi:MAG: protein tyrosine/serine phosphatase [Crocinitomicaceae bacterium]|jgi:protein tyrosine/serine phosphatase
MSIYTGKGERMNFRRCTPLLFLVSSFIFLSLQKERPTLPNHVKNFHQVDDQLFRSGQPQKKGMQELQAKMKVKTIINLRNVIDDKQEIKGTSLIQVRIPMRAKVMNYQNIVDALCAIENAEKPVLVHCLHGSDRTGGVVAAYRMIHGWTKEKALEEFQLNHFGYNSQLFPNILELLRSIDVEKLKKNVPCSNY